MSSKTLEKQIIDFCGYKIILKKTEELYPSGNKGEFLNIELKKGRKLIDELGYLIQKVELNNEG